MVNYHSDRASSSTRFPQLSVVVATYDRYDMLSEALAALKAQNCEVGFLEVIVIDNSPDQIAAAGFWRALRRRSSDQLSAGADAGAIACDRRACHRSKPIDKKLVRAARRGRPFPHSSRMPAAPRIMRRSPAIICAITSPTDRARVPLGFYSQGLGIVYDLDFSSLSGGQELDAEGRPSEPRSLHHRMLGHVRAAVQTRPWLRALA